MKFGRETGIGCLPGFSGGVNVRLVRQRRIAAHAEVVLHAALGRQAVVVPSHRIEHGLAAHALEARDDVGVRVREDVTDVQRAADGRRRRVDRIDVARGRGCGRSDRPVPLPAIRPFLFETFEGGLVGDGDRVAQVQAIRHPVSRQTIRDGSD